MNFVILKLHEILKPISLDLMWFSVRIVARENFGTSHTGTATVIVIIQICSPEKRKQDEHVFPADDFKINLHIGPPKHALNKSYRYASYNKKSA